MEFAQFVTSLSSKLGILSLRPDAAGVYAFVLSKEWTLRLQEDPSNKHCYLSSIVYYPPTPGKDRRAILTICLEANYFAQGTNGAVFAFDRAANAVVFFRTFNTAKTTQALFFKALDDFFLHIQEWRRRFESKDYYGSWRKEFRGMQPDTLPDFWTRV